MRGSMYALIVVLAFFMSFAAVQSAQAETVTGLVEETNRDDGIIVIDPGEGEDLVTINCFPYGYAQRELEEALDVDEDVYIEKGDCVTVQYGTVVSRFGDEKIVAVALLMYCDDCGNQNCFDVVENGDEPIVFREDLFEPLPDPDPTEEDGHRHKVKKDKKPKPGKQDKKDKKHR